MTENLVLQISKIISEVNQRIDKKIIQWESVRASVAFRRMEVEITTMARELADQITEKLLRAIVLNGGFQQQTVEALRQTGKYRNGGWYANDESDAARRPNDNAEVTISKGTKSE